MTVGHNVSILMLVWIIVGGATPNIRLTYSRVYAMIFKPFGIWSIFFVII